MVDQIGTPGNPGGYNMPGASFAELKAMAQAQKNTQLQPGAMKPMPSTGRELPANDPRRLPTYIPSGSRTDWGAAPLQPQPYPPPASIKPLEPNLSLRPGSNPTSRFRSALARGHFRPRQPGPVADAYRRFLGAAPRVQPKAPTTVPQQPGMYFPS